jgi:TolB-like protein
MPMSLFNELKRRNVFKVAFAYIIVAWLSLQVSDTLVPALHLPEWFHSGVAFLLIIGFPIAMIFAWAFEMTPEGLKKEKEVDRTNSISKATGQKLNHTLLFLMAAALAYFAWDKFAANIPDNTVLDQRIPTAEAVKTADPSKVQKPDEKSIAVIPFQNRSANEENTEFFSDGVHDELLTNLSKIHELKVISRTSVMNYRDTTKNLRQIGEELGVAKILEGGVQRAGDTVRINVQLIDAATDEHLWAEVYDRQLTTENIFAIQTEIARAIANELEATLSPQEQKILESTPTTNLEAYDNLLLARELFERGNWQNLWDAHSYLEKTIQLDPEYVEAYVLLARTYFMLTATGATTVQEIKTPWNQAIQAAISLDSDNAIAYATQAQYLWQNNLDGVDTTFEKARQLEPRNTEIMTMYADYLRKTFHPEQALSLYKMARELDPISINLLYGIARIYEAYGEMDKTLEIYARIRQISPANSTGYGPNSGVYMLLGDMVQSLNWIFKATTIDPDDSDLYNYVVLLYIDFGDYTRAKQWISWLEQSLKLNPMTLANRAMLSINEGNVNASIPYTRRAFEEELSDRWGSDSVLVRALLIWALDQGQTGTALEMIKRSHPELFDERPFLNAGNVLQAIDTAHLLRSENLNDEAERLLRAVIKAYEKPYAIAEPWMASGKAQALAMLGEKQAALSELQYQVENGWRSSWRWHTELNPNFESLKRDPEFQAIVEFLRKDMARQLVDLRAMEVAGEIPSPPGDDKR